jgi:hypothetical protein
MNQVKIIGDLDSGGEGEVGTLEAGKLFDSWLWLMDRVKTRARSQRRP